MKTKSLLILILVSLGLCVTSHAGSGIVLNPYVFTSQVTPMADKILEAKLKNIVTKSGLAGSQLNGLSPFILTANAIELKKEQTSTMPPQTAVDLSVTFYVGNGEDGTLFSSCNMEVTGIGSNIDNAYASAFKKINIDNPELTNMIDIGRQRIEKYYTDASPGLIAKAKALASSDKYADAYTILLNIPSCSPNYTEAQNLIVKCVQKENDENNFAILREAKAAWASSPNEEGAATARRLLGAMNNVSPSVDAQTKSLLNEMSSRLKTIQDKETARTNKLESEQHQERMAIINGVIKVAAARASRPVYRIRWW